MPPTRPSIINILGADHPAIVSMLNAGGGYLETISDLLDDIAKGKPSPITQMGGVTKKFADAVQGAKANLLKEAVAVHGLPGPSRLAKFYTGIGPNAAPTSAGRRLAKSFTTAFNPSVASVLGKGAGLGSGVTGVLEDLMKDGDFTSQLPQELLDDINSSFPNEGLGEQGTAKGKPKPQARGVRGAGGGHAGSPAGGQGKFPQRRHQGRFVKGSGLVHVPRGPGRRYVENTARGTIPMGSGRGELVYTGEGRGGGGGGGAAAKKGASFGGKALKFGVKGFGILGTLWMLYDIGKAIKDTADDVTGGPMRARRELEKGLGQMHQEGDRYGGMARQKTYLEELKGAASGSQYANIFNQMSSTSHEATLDELVRGHELELASLAHREPPSLMQAMRPVGL